MQFAPPDYPLYAQLFADPAMSTPVAIVFFLDFFLRPHFISTTRRYHYRPLLLHGQSIDSALTTPTLQHFRGQDLIGEKTMANGTVKWFNTTKGYGFIAPESGGKDVFVHISAVERSGLTGLADDQKVTFDIEPGRDGRESAINIALA